MARRRRNVYYRDKAGRWRVIRAKDGRNVPSKKPTRPYLDRSGRERDPRTGRIIPKQDAASVQRRTERRARRTRVYQTPRGLLNAIRRHLERNTGISWRLVDSATEHTDWWSRVAGFEPVDGQATYEQVTAALEDITDDNRIIDSPVASHARALVHVADAETGFGTDANGDALDPDDADAKWYSSSVLPTTRGSTAIDNALSRLLGLFSGPDGMKERYPNGNVPRLQLRLKF